MEAQASKHTTMARSLVRQVQLRGQYQMVSLCLLLSHLCSTLHGFPSQFTITHSYIRLIALPHNGSIVLIRCIHRILDGSLLETLFIFPFLRRDRRGCHHWSSSRARLTTASKATTSNVGCTTSTIGSDRCRQRDQPRRVRRERQRLGSSHD